MKIIKTIELEQYNDTERYKKIEDGIYEILKGDCTGYFEISLLTELENVEMEEDTQYPLEDLLDKFYCHTTYTELTEDVNYKFNMLADDLQDIKAIKELVGKRVYNKENGEYVSLIIE